MCALRTTGTPHSHSVSSRPAFSQLQAHQQRLGRSPRCEALAYEGAARVQAVTVKEPPTADSKMYGSSYLAEASAGVERWHMASMHRERNLVAACFELRGIISVDTNPTTKGVGYCVFLVFTVHSQDDCQVVFENTLLSSLLFSSLLFS